VRKRPAAAGEEGLRAQYERDGYLLLKGFATREECQGMQKRMDQIIDRWDPDKTLAPVFVTSGGDGEKGAEGSQLKSDYFLDSADRVHFFLEKGAAAEDGKLKPDLAKRRALNKVGHGLHVVDDVFRSYSESEKVSKLVQELGYRDPVLPQSMYIFKQPAIGGEVPPHQDSTFLHTTPRPTCMGLWLALDAATLGNGCLWARPGSHKEPVRRLFVRNPEHFGGDASAQQMIFEDLEKLSPDEGKMPKGWEPPSRALYEQGWKHLECEVGDLVVIHGQVDHMSLPNTSERPRDTFQLHLIEGPEQGITWSARNWLQYPEARSFPSLRQRGGAKRKAESL